MARNPRGKHLTLGVLAGWQFYWTATPLSYLDPVYRGIRKAAREHGCNLLLGCGMGPSATTSDPMRPAWPVAADDSDFVPIGPWNTDGLIAVNPLHSPARSAYLRQLRAAGHPLVFVGSGETGPAIVADNAGGVSAAMRHLVEHGHHAIAFIAGSPEDMDGDTGARLRAYETAIEQLGLPFDARLVAFGHHIFAAGQVAMQQVLDTGAPFTAVLASNDESALGAMQALTAAGRRIPEDVAIIGFDDRQESAVQTPPLSSVHLPLFQMGVQAVELLLQQIDRRGAPDARVEVHTRLVARESCGCGERAVRLNRPGGPGWTPATLTDAMCTAVLADAQALNPSDAYDLCARLLDTFTDALREPAGGTYTAALESLLARAAASDDDAQIWQPALSLLSSAADQLVPGIPDSVRTARAAYLLDTARRAISSAVWRRHRQAAVTERWTMDRMGRLTANLLTALDETQVFHVLAQRLPEMDIHAAWLAEFELDAGTPGHFAEWCTVRAITDEASPAIRTRTIEFPPCDLVQEVSPFSLALLPVVGPRGQHGFAAFESTQLVLYGAIVQQLAAALNTAQLYREATEARRLAEDANRMKERFLSTVSHELRTPLNLVVGTSAILLQENTARESTLPEQIQRDIERIHAAAQHLTGLIGDVLDLASSNAGQLRLTNDYVELRHVLRLPAETGRRLATEKGLMWHAELPETGAWVWGDRTRLRQVALNLITNAVKFTDRGRVSLRVSTSAGMVTVAVEDTGIGIAPDEQQAVFDEFRRTARSVEQGYSGLGLGLAIAKRIVELHGGIIGVQSTGEGAGATFFFALPLVHAPAQEPSRSGTAEHLGTPAGDELPARTILVVDDDPETLDMHVRMVQAHSRGNRVLRARGGREALALMQRSQIDLVLLDLAMPEMDGFSVLAQMRTQPGLRDVPVIVVTGQTLTDAEMARLNLGVTTILSKGLYSLDETLAHLDAALEHRRRLSTDAQQLVRKAMAFLHEHYAESMTRQDIARHVGLDEDYLTYCFRQELGVTPIAYLNRYRVNQAKTLLKQSNLSITAIAQAVGFADSGYFSRIFRREVGLSPDAYRRG